MQHQGQADAGKRFPLLEAQNGIVLSWMQHPQLTQHNMGFAHRLTKDISVERLRDAMVKTAWRHDTFSTRIEQTEKGFFQYVDSTIVHDVKVSRMTEVEYAAYKRLFVHPFDMLNDVLLRMEIVETDQFVYALTDMAHCIADGYTLSQFWKEVDETYQGREPEAENRLELAVSREQLSFDTPAYEEARQHCQQTFSGMEITHIPTTAPHAMGAIKEIATPIDKQLVDTFCEQQNISPSIFFMIANAMALSAFCNEDQIVTDSLYHGRSDVETAQTMSMFVKNILVRFDFGENASSTISELAAITQQQFHVQHKGIYPFTHLSRELDLSSYNNTFTFQNWYQPVSINGVVAHSEYLKDGQTDDFTMLLIYPVGKQYQVTCYYNDARYQEWLIREYVDCIVNIAGNIITHPDATIAEIAFVAQQKKAAMLQQSEGETLEHEESFMTLFERQAQATPDAIAVADACGRMTYAQLDFAASTLAGALQLRGIKAADIIAVQMPRTKEYIVAVLGILKMGAAFLPIDQDYPQSRKDYILTDSQATMLVTQDLVEELLAGEKTAATYQKVLVTPEATAYIIYTSGSTGNPKGVMIPHRALDSFVHTCVHTYQLTAEDRIFCHSNFSFDASVEDLFPILSCGGQLHIPSEAMRKDVSAIRQYISDNQITGGNYTTAFGELLMDACAELPVRYITLGGERLDKLPTNQHCRFFNSYGPTEFTVDATFWERPVQYAGNTIPIGRPVCNCKAYVLDAHHRLLPNGCTGQLFLAGPQCALGYLHQPELTHEKFLANPFSTSMEDIVMYATGDMVRWNVEGQLEYVGRTDTQVKLRGFRIELGEIDTTLSHMDGIIQSLTRITTFKGRDILCSWYTTSDGRPVSNIRQLSLKRLPKFMVPDIFVALQSFPLTSNGKIDVKQLPLPVSEDTQQQIVTPSSNAERMMIRLVREITGTENLSVTDDLFDEVGLSSLQAIKLAFMAKAEGVDVNVTSFYEWRTIRAVFQHSGKRNAHYWAEGKYDPSKPVAILICGYVYVHPLYDNLINYFKRRYSIYVMDAFHENFMWKKDISCDILMSEYMEAFRRDVLGKPLELIMGTCYGADLAIPFANCVKEETGVAHRLLAMDPVYSRKDMDDSVPYEMNPDEAIVEQYRISALLGKTVPTPAYDGPMIIVGPSDMSNRKYPEYDGVYLTAEEEQEYIAFMHKNDKDWATHFPQVPKYKVPGDHYRFLETRNLPMIEGFMDENWYK